FHGGEPAMQRVGQLRNIADAHGHFRYSALRSAQSGEQGTRHLAALDGRLRHRAIFFVRGKNFSRPRFDRTRGRKQSLVAPPAGKRRKDARSAPRPPDHALDVGGFELVLRYAHLRSNNTILSRLTSTPARPPV